MRGRGQLALWTLEFLSVTAIGILPATTAPLWWLALPVFALLGAKFGEHKLEVRERRLALRQQLRLLLELLPRDGAGVRCTYHVPVRGPLGRQPMLWQLFDYLPSGGGGGRRFPASKGIIGKTFQTKGPRVENFRNDAEYRSKMLQDYNYTASELGERTADRRSYLCYPILDENHVVLGLIYFDSRQCGLFTMDDSNPRWVMIRDASEVIRAEVLR